jgi:DHA1 family multidrug resistance protein-like MFS transporter
MQCPNSVLGPCTDRLSLILGIMKDLIRDTIFSHALRLMTGGKVFKYPEEEDSSLWKKYVHTEKSANMAKHGQVQPPTDNEQQSRSSSSSTVVPSRRSGGVNGASGHPIDKEKGKDVYVVDWYGPDDPEVRSPSLPYVH